MDGQLSYIQLVGLFIAGKFLFDTVLNKEGYWFPQTKVKDLYTDGLGRGMRGLANAEGDWWKLGTDTNNYLVGGRPWSAGRYELYGNSSSF